MTHEPECQSFDGGHICICDVIRPAYQRGREDAAEAVKADIAKHGEAYESGHWHCCFRDNAISAARGEGGV